MFAINCILFADNCAGTKYDLKSQAHSHFCKLECLTASNV